MCLRGLDLIFYAMLEAIGCGCDGIGTIRGSVTVDLENLECIINKGNPCDEHLRY